MWQAARVDPTTDMLLITEAADVGLCSAGCAAADADNVGVLLDQLVTSNQRLLVMLVRDLRWI